MLHGIRAITDRGVVRVVFSPLVDARPHHLRMLGASRLKMRAGHETFELPATPRVYRGLRKYFRESVGSFPIGFDEVANRIFAYDETVGNETTDFQRNFLAAGYCPPPIPITSSDPSPWDHQLRTFWFAVDRCGGLHSCARGGALIGLDMGCGKSRTAIDLIVNYGWSNVLIICPQKVIDAVWPSQFEQWCDPSRFKIVPLSGSTKRRRAQLDDAMAKRTSKIVAVTNYEGVDYHDVRKAILSYQWDACFLDEGHRIKDPTGKRSKWFAKFADQVPCRFVLTGTKEPNTPLDIFAQARWIDRTYYGSQYSAFRSQYAIIGENPILQDAKLLGIKNEEDLAQKNFQFCLEVDAEEVQDLPDSHHVNVPVILSPKTRKQYDRFEKELVIEVQNEEVTAANVRVKIGKLAEITGGFIRNPDTKEVFTVGSEKVDMLKEKIADLPPDDPIVVFYRFSPDAERIASACDDLGRSHMEVSGRINQLKEWKQATGGEVLICQISSGKEGVDLTRSRWCFFYSLGYQPGEFKQSIKRQHRPGQKASRVTFFHLVAAQTVDVRIYAAIRKKQSMIDVVRTLAKEYGYEKVF